ncbi:MAG: hypothetical protein K2X35_03655 [Bryobacteraceae bacterium]|nr:hypothetical protein [Bryobacteraceae bacterium]
MSLTALLVSATRNIAPVINVPSALLTLYLTGTALLTVRPLGRWTAPAAAGCAFIGFGLAFLCGASAVYSLVKGGPDAGLAPPLVFFGGLALAGAIGDTRAARNKGPRGSARLRRHLWRMCLALFVASIAFYLGPDRLPVALQLPWLRALGVLAPVGIAAFWLRRLRDRRSPNPALADATVESYR